MPDANQEPVGTPLPEEIFKLNLSYLLLAQRMIAQDEHQAEIVLGVREPLTSWLRGASVHAVAALARSPIALHEMRLPKEAATTVLGACNDARWLGPLHVTMTAIEVNREHSE
jgi:hypothetical protein